MYQEQVSCGQNNKKWASVNDKAYRQQTDLDYESAIQDEVANLDFFSS